MEVKLNIVADVGSTYYCPGENKTFKVIDKKTAVEITDPYEIADARDNRATNWDQFTVQKGRCLNSGSHAVPTASPDTVASASSNASPNVADPVSGNSGLSAEPQTQEYSAEQSKSVEIALVQRLMGRYGLTRPQAAGIVGNLAYESGGAGSGLNPGIVQGNTYGDPSRGEGIGWAQWSGSRKADFLAFSKERNLPWNSPAANLAFLEHELDQDPSFLNALRQTSTAGQATQSFYDTFERAGPGYQSSVTAPGGRQSIADSLA